ncbi:MAG: hypothetical protein AB7O80_20065 [Acetobacteraceae bacterium]
MRTLVQPGRVAPRRIDIASGNARRIAFDLAVGMTLHDAVAGPMAAAGFQGGTVVVRGGAFDPFKYVMPGPPDDASHVAYFTAPRAPEGVTRLERANLTFGWADEVPFLHCHAVWIEPDGARRGGHILPRETVLAVAAEADAWGFPDVRVETGFDAETNFTLFGVAGAQTGGKAVVARVKPNEDISHAVEAIAREQGWQKAIVRGSLGSLVGARFADGRTVPDLATEVLVRRGVVRDGRAELDLAVVDMTGAVHEGVLARGDNAVLITFDLVMDGTGA